MQHIVRQKDDEREADWTKGRWNLLCNVAYHFHLTSHQETFQWWNK